MTLDVHKHAPDIRRSLSGAALLFSFLALAGCGGGGGDGGTPAPSIAVSKSSAGSGSSFNGGSISVSSSVLQASVASVPLNVSWTSGSGATYYLAVSYTTSGMTGAAIQILSADTALITVNFRPPTSLKPGTYADSVGLELCTDSACTTKVAGSALTIPVQYTVTPYSTSSTPAIAFAQTSVTPQALAVDPLQLPPITINFTMMNFVIAPYVSSSIQNPGVSGANVATSSTTQGSLTLTLLPGNIIGAGTYSGSVTVTACLDATCANPVPGSPFLIDVTYTVGSTVSMTGSAGYTVQVMELACQGMVWDPVHQLLYVVLPFDSSSVSHVVAIDPVAQTTTTPTALDSTSNGAISISDDGQFLYLGMSNGEVQRLSLPGLTTDLRITTGQALSSAGIAVNISVAPGTPHTIAVALSSYAYGGESGSETGVAIFDDNVERPTIAPAVGQPASGTPVDYVQWGATTTQLYGTTFSGGRTPFYSMTVNATGVGASIDEGAVSGGNMHAAQGSLFLDGGSIINLTTNQISNPFSATPNLYGLLPDAATGRLFVSNSVQLAGSVQIQAYDLQNLTSLAQIALPPIAVQQQDWTLWGTNGIVIRTPNDLVFVSGNFVSP